MTAKFETLAAIIVIGILESVALILGYDGVLLAGTVGVLAALGGYQYGVYRSR